MFSTHFIDREPMYFLQEDVIHLLMDTLQELNFNFQLLQLLLQDDTRGGGFVHILKKMYCYYHVSLGLQINLMVAY